MPRFLIAALAAALLLVPATAEGKSSARLRGTVAEKNVAGHLVTVRAARKAVALRVPGSLAAIRIGQRVELRGSTLRQRGNGSRVLARNVAILSSGPLASSSAGAAAEPNDDEVEMKGTLTSLSPLTVASHTRTVTCAVPAGKKLAGFAVGDFVEITCDLIGGSWVLRKLEHEDDDQVGAARGDDDDDNSGPGAGSDDDDDNSGPGAGNDDDDDNSGPGGGDDDDDDSGPGGGDDD